MGKPGLGVPDRSAGGWGFALSSSQLDGKKGHIQSPGSQSWLIFF